MATVRMTNLASLMIVVVAVASLTYCALIFIEQVVDYQYVMGNSNNTIDNSTNESDTISSLPMPIRPPFA
jgi:hypothetical protein